VGPPAPMLWTRTRLEPVAAARTIRGCSRKTSRTTARTVIKQRTTKT
jgi:hypothetical protein